MSKIRSKLSIKNICDLYTVRVRFSHRNQIVLKYVCDLKYFIYLS